MVKKLGVDKSRLVDILFSKTYNSELSELTYFASEKLRMRDILYLGQLRMNCVLTKEDWEIKESLDKSLEILLIIYRCNTVNEVDQKDKRELRSKLAKLTPQKVY